MIVDTHTHLLPEPLASKIRQFFDAGISGDLAYESGSKKVVRSHLDDGAVAAWNLPYAHKPGMSAKLNADIAQLSKDLSVDGFQVLPGCTVHPGDTDPAQLLRTAVEQHGAVVCKLHCSVGDYEADDPRLSDVYESAALLSIPMIIHAGHSVLGTTDGNEIQPIVRAAKAHPDTTIIVAHLGFPSCAEVLEAMRALPNLWADLTPVLHGHPELESLDLEPFADRLLFGTDAPNTGLRLDDYASYVRSSIGLSDEGVEMVLWKNAQHLTHPV